MKKLLMLVLFLTPCLVGFNSCSDDDDDSKPTGSLAHEWKGDYNDPLDPGYRASFNPIEGKWVRDTNPFKWMICRRGEDGKLYMDFYANRGENGGLTPERTSRYGINDEAYMLYDEKDKPLSIWLYTISGNVLTVQLTDQTHATDIYTYTRQ
ncbi:hypothetical protein [Dysgonomonas sp. 25]|uniref:hypothetical protein n=1 Tax=Dysgonomonas sp. 25 TaxID=2302933 RepID=UPI0013D120AA|nr:hypothetical protein [Dysgonomonas sp. 25]NDV69204.1 hypothetical protein [Dysgonomonas sp. 25]